MAAESDDASISTGHLESGLGASDIETHVYEGGFKSWEGALDLARLLLERGPRRDLDEMSRVGAVVEMGCGQALPSLILFQHALRMHSSGDGRGMSFTFADYNESVLKLVTLPNVLLVWALERAIETFRGQGIEEPSIATDGKIINGDGDLEITAELKERFVQDMEQCGLELLFLSGPWSEALVKMMPLQDDLGLLAMGAETIYSPASLAAFTDTLVALLKRVKMSKGIVASKRVYFGVGGSVDEFRQRASKAGAVAYEVEDSGIEGCDKSLGTGVGRCLLEVQMC